MGAAVRALAQGDLVAAAEAPVGAMIPVYVLNLKRSPERRAFMAEGLARAGAPFAFVAAADGRRCRSGGALAKAETALILSHRKAWRRLLREGASHALVLEDDAHIGEGFAGLLDADWGALAFDAVKLETMFDRVWVKRGGDPFGGRRLRRLGAEHLGAAGYVVSAGGARKLLELTRGLVEPVDHTLFGRANLFSGRVVAYQLCPAIVVQDQLQPDPGVRRRLATTLHESDRVALAAEARRNRPRGLARVQREARRFGAQLARLWRLWPRYRRERVEWE